MATITPKMAAARSFVRSLNILLKFVRLYGFDHSRSAEQFRVAWNELRAAIPMGDQTGLLLGAAGSQIVLDGAPIEGAHAERSFAQLLTAAGLASIQFLPKVTEDEFARFIRAFPIGNSKASALAEQLKNALADSPGIRINEVRFVAASQSAPEKSVAAMLASNALTGEAGQFRKWLNDPEKLLQLITAAEGSRTGNLGAGTGGDAKSGEGTGSYYSGAGSDDEGGSGSGSGGSGAGIGSGTGTHDSGTGTGGWHEATTGNGPGPETGTADSFSGGMGIGGTGAGGKGTCGWNSGQGSGRGTDASGTGAGGWHEAGTGSGPGPGTGTASSFSGGMGIGGKGTGGWSSGQGSGTGPDGATSAGSGVGSAGKAFETGVGLGPGKGPGAGPGKGRGEGGTSAASGPGDTGGIPARDPRDEEILLVLRLLARIGQTVDKHGGGLDFGPGSAAHQEIEKLPERPRNLLRAALTQLGAQTPAVKSNDPMLIRLAEHLAIRFALDRYERGEVRVNAVRQMLDRMNQEIATLRGILGSHEEKMAGAGLVVESHLDVLDRQFWAAVPESGKRAVLTSPDAWCVPPRNLRQYVEELRRKGEEALATQILDNYGAAITHSDGAARRRVAIGLPEIADLYAVTEQLLTSVIRYTGSQLMAEREDDLQGLISAAFVRLTQEAGAERVYAAMLQALDSLEGIERQRPTFAQDVRPRLGIEKRIPELVDHALQSPCQESLIELLKRMPGAVTEHLLSRFNRAQLMADCERIADLAGPGKLELTSRLRETLQMAQPSEAAETVGLLSRLDVAAVEMRLGERLRDWPRLSQDRALRLIAAGGAAKRGSLLLAVLDRFEPILQPLAVDEIGMSGEKSAQEKLKRLASDEQPDSTEPLLRLKAIEALGRLHADRATELLRDIIEAKKHWRYLHHIELRIAALQTLETISPKTAEAVRAGSGLTATDLSFDPQDRSPAAMAMRQRRYPRARLKATLPATATSEKETILLEVRALSLSGGIANGSKHLPPGTLVSLRLGPGLRPIRARVIMREARAQGLGFEFVAMDLADRARLRLFLCQNGEILQEPREAEEVAEEPVGLQK